MARASTILCAVMALVVFSATARGQAVKMKPAPPDERSFVVSPTVEPTPAFRYTLFPNAALRKPGNAAPIYLRFAHERNPDQKRAQLRDSMELLSAERGKFDLAKSRTLINQSSWILSQLDHAAHRQYCDWAYTIEEDRESVFSILLGDAQESRGYHRLLCLKARVETEEGKIDDAIRTLETAFSMAEQQAQGPFLINGLIGIASAFQASERVEDLMRLPDGPSLYWALAGLPRPVISLRRGFDLETAIADIAFPELQTLESAVGSAEFDARLARVLERIRRLHEESVEFAEPLKIPSAQELLARVGEARAYLRAQKTVSNEWIEKMSDSQALLYAIRAQMREVRDQRYKAVVLPPREAVQVEQAEPPRLSPAPFLPYSPALYPPLQNARQSSARLERRMAALRLIEALRLHAKQNQGKLPRNLAEATIVPLPEDPTTGLPFRYRLEANTATIESPRSGDLLPSLKYTVSLRK